jgi:hypothetical protein
MGSQQEHPAGRDGSYEKEAAATSLGKKQTVCLSDSEAACESGED